MSLQSLFDDNLKQVWDATPAADDPIPQAEYNVETVKGELFRSKGGTQGYKITWRVSSGEHTGRLVWQDLWLTPAALPMTKRTLKQIGITSLEQLGKVLPTWSAVAWVVVRRSDSGDEFNEVKKLSNCRIEQDEVAAPKDKEGNTKPDEVIDQDFYNQLYNVNKGGKDAM